MTQAKAGRVLEYLRNREKQVPIDYHHDIGTGTHQYRFSMPRCNVILKLSDEFLSDQPYEEIIRVIDQSSIFKKIYEAVDLLNIYITNQGITEA